MEDPAIVNLLEQIRDGVNNLPSRLAQLISSQNQGPPETLGSTSGRAPVSSSGGGWDRPRGSSDPLPPIQGAASPGGGWSGGGGGGGSMSPSNMQWQMQNLANSMYAQRAKANVKINPEESADSEVGVEQIEGGKQAGGEVIAGTATPAYVRPPRISHEGYAPRQGKKTYLYNPQAKIAAGNRQSGSPIEEAFPNWRAKHPPSVMEEWFKAGKKPYEEKRRRARMASMESDVSPKRTSLKMSAPQEAPRRARIKTMMGASHQEVKFGAEKDPPEIAGAPPPVNPAPGIGAEKWNSFIKAVAELAALIEKNTDELRKVAPGDRQAYDDETIGKMKEVEEKVNKMSSSEESVKAIVKALAMYGIHQGGGQRFIPPPDVNAPAAEHTSK